MLWQSRVYTFRRWWGSHSNLPSAYTGAMSQKRALVTGVGRSEGIGAGIARALAADGWDLALSFWHPYDQRVNQATTPQEDLLALSAELEAIGSRVVLLPADLEHPAAADVLIERAAGELGPLTGLVLSHTESVDSSVLDTTVESFTATSR